jgi:MFS family permease
VGLPIDMRTHGLSAASFGAVIALNGVLIVLLQPAAGEMIRDRRRPPVLAVASLLLAAGFGMNAWIGSLPAFAAAVCIWTLGEILFAPASVSLVADLAPAHLRGRYQGVYAVATTAAFAAAPAAGGYTIGAWGTQTLWLACGATGLLVAAGFVLLGLAMRDLSR